MISIPYFLYRDYFDQNKRLSDALECYRLAGLNHSQRLQELENKKREIDAWINEQDQGLNAEKNIKRRGKGKGKDKIVEIEGDGEEKSLDEHIEYEGDEGEVKSAEDTTEKVVEGSATDNGVVFELSYNALQDGYRGTLTRGDWTAIHMGWLNGQRVVASIDEIIVTCSQHPNILNILDIIREGVSFPIILVEKVNWINSYFQERRGRFRESYVDQPGAVTVQTWWDNIQIDFRKIFR